jgi:hypothetical protein
MKNSKPSIGRVPSHRDSLFAEYLQLWSEVQTKHYRSRAELDRILNRINDLLAALQSMNQQPGFSPDDRHTGHPES